MRISVSQLRHLHLANYLTMLFKNSRLVFVSTEKKENLWNLYAYPLVGWFSVCTFELQPFSSHKSDCSTTFTPPPSPPQASEVGRCRVNHVWYPPLLATFPDDFRISAHHVKTCFSIPALSFSEIRPGVTVFITFSFVRNCDDESIANNERI